MVHHALQVNGELSDTTHQSSADFKYEVKVSAIASLHLPSLDVVSFPLV